MERALEEKGEEERRSRKWGGGVERDGKGRGRRKDKGTGRERGER